MFARFHTQNSRTCDCDEIEKLQEQNERLERIEQERRDARKQELQELYEEEKRSASDWREALIKQSRLYAQEARDYPETDSNGVDSFSIAAKACEKAVEFWDEISLQKQVEIEELKNRIKAIEDSIRIETCAKLRSFYCTPELEEIECFVISSLEEGGDPEDWLSW